MSSGNILHTRRKRLFRKIKNIKGLMLYYPMLETEGTTAVDYGPNKRDGVITDTELGELIPPYRGFGFDGLASFIQTPDHASIQFNLTNTFTMGFIINMDSLDNNVLPRFWEKRSLFGCFMGDETNGKFKKVAMELVDGEGAQAEFWGNTNQLVIGNTYFVIQTYNIDGETTDGFNNRGKIYLNGVQESTDEIFVNDGDLQSTSGLDFFIGKSRTGFARVMDGRMSNLFMVNRALESSEIVELNRAGGFL